MSVLFVNVVENIKQLSIEEKQELKDLLNNYLIEERREEILQNHQTAKQNFAAGTLMFSDDLDELEAMLND